MTALELLNITQEQKVKGVWIDLGDGIDEYKIWHRNGHLRANSQWKNGKRHGESKIWFSRGELARHEIYEDGVMVKSIYDYNSNKV